MERAFGLILLVILHDQSLPLESELLKVYILWLPVFDFLIDFNLLLAQIFLLEHLSFTSHHFELLFRDTEVFTFHVVLQVWMSHPFFCTFIQITTLFNIVFRWELFDFYRSSAPTVVVNVARKTVYTLVKYGCFLLITDSITLLSQRCITPVSLFAHVQICVQITIHSIDFQLSLLIDLLV